MPSTTGTTPATIADMIDGRGKGEGASKSAQHRTQSSGILDAYSIDPEQLNGGTQTPQQYHKVYVDGKGTQ